MIWRASRDCLRLSCKRAETVSLAFPLVHQSLLRFAVFVKKTILAVYHKRRSISQRLLHLVRRLAQGRSVALIGSLVAPQALYLVATVAYSIDTAVGPFGVAPFLLCDQVVDSGAAPSVAQMAYLERCTANRTRFGYPSAVDSTERRTRTCADAPFSSPLASRSSTVDRE